MATLESRLEETLIAKLSDLKYVFRRDIRDRASLEARITAQAAKIESLKTHKRGLMQQLFPASEEVQA